MRALDRFANFADRLIAPSVGPRGTHEYRRAQNLVNGCFLIAVLAIPFAVADYISEGCVSPTVVVFVIGAPALAANPFLLRRTSSVRLAAVIALLELSVAFGLMIAFHGGLGSAALPWSLVIPMLAGIWLGPALAFVAAGLIALEIGVIAALHRSGFVFPQPLSPEINTLWLAAGAAGVTMVVAVLGGVYETITRHAVDQRAELLRERENVIRSLMATSLDAVATVDAAGAIQTWNRPATQMFGWTAKQVLGQDLADTLLASRSREQHRKALSRLLSDTDSRVFVQRLELSGLHTRGHELLLDVAVSPPVQLDGRRVFIVFLRDLTTRAKARTRVRELHRDLVQVIESIPDGVVVHAGTRVIYANPTWRNWFGKPGVAAHDTGPLDCVDPDQADALLSRLTQAAGDAGELVEDFGFTAHDGSTRSLELAIVHSIRFEGHEASLLVARDTTERNQLQSKLLIANRMSSMGVLVAGVAHEINNPLFYIMSNLETLEHEFTDDGPSDIPRHELVEMIREARIGSERVRDIVRELKSFSRVSDDHSGPADLRAAVRTTLRMAANQIRHVASLEEEYEEVPAVCGDQAKLAQVFLNLVVNSVQAFEQGDPESNKLRIRVGVDGNKRGFAEITDNGSGIPPHVLSCIFDPFFTTKEVGVGTGLGLSICHSIVTGYGGAIDVTSEPGKGTTFLVSLPLAEPHTPTSTMSRGA